MQDFVADLLNNWTIKQQTKIPFNIYDSETKGTLSEQNKANVDCRQ